MKKTILTMSEREVKLERIKLERSGHIAGAEWYFDNLLEQLKNGRA